MDDVSGFKWVLFFLLVFIFLGGCYNDKDSIPSATPKYYPTPSPSKDPTPVSAIAQTETSTSFPTPIPSKDPTPISTITQTETNTPSPSPTTNATLQLAQLTPYDILNKIRGIEHFSGGTFDGLSSYFDIKVLTFSTPVIYNSDENIFEQRDVDITNGDVYKGQKEWFYNLFDSTTYPKTSELQEYLEVKSNQNQIDEIEKQLYSETNVYYSVWSPQYTYLSYYVGNEDEGIPYIWKVGDEAPEIIDVPYKDRFFFDWSPNEDYVLLDTGTSITRGGILYSINRKTSKPINYISRVHFSLDSKWLLMHRTSGIHSDLKKDYELDETIDLVLLNLDNFEEKIIIKATDQIEYYFVGWKNNDEIIYKKHDFVQNSDEELTFTLN